MDHPSVPTIKNANIVKLTYGLEFMKTLGVIKVTLTEKKSKLKGKQHTLDYA